MYMIMINGMMKCSTSQALALLALYLILAIVNDKLVVDGFVGTDEYSFDIFGEDYYNDYYDLYADQDTTIKDDQVTPDALYGLYDPGDSFYDEFLDGRSSLNDTLVFYTYFEVRVTRNGHFEPLYSVLNWHFL